MNTRDYLVQLSKTIDVLLKKHYIIAIYLLIMQPALMLFFMIAGEIIDVTEERLNKK